MTSLREKKKRNILEALQRIAMTMKLLQEELDQLSRDMGDLIDE